MNNILTSIKESFLENNMAKIKNLLPELFRQADEGKIVEFPCKIGKCAVSYQGETYMAASIDFNNGEVNLNGADIVPLNKCSILWMGE